MDAFQEYFVDIIKNHYADFEGRARRKEYWMFTLFTFLLSVAIVVFAGIVGFTISETVGGVLFLLFYLLNLALLLPSLGLTVRRLHDTGRSGWWALVSFVPLVGAFVLLYFMVIEGDAGPNTYGPDPKDPYPAGAGIGEFSGVLDR